MSARVLVVDDILPNVKLLEAKLSSAYFEVITALNGVDALELAEKQGPDIILLDVMMPGMDGFEVCEKLKENPKRERKMKSVRTSCCPAPTSVFLFQPRRTSP